MSIEIKTTNLEEIKGMAENLLEKAVSEKDITKRASLFEDVNIAVDAFNTQSKANCYKAAKQSGNPMHYACKEFFYPAIKVKEVKDKDTKISVFTISDCEKPIDIGDMHKRLEGIGADTKWYYLGEKLNFYLSIRAAERVGTKINMDCFRMNEISKQIEMGKTPLSNTNILKTLQSVITAMLGEGFKCTSHDVNFLIDVYANDNKKSKTAITAANHKTLRGYLKKVCHRILTDSKSYEVEQKEIKTV